jgi:leader peptidase (prepilin peptidase)/N-methyltransferase
MKAMIYLVLIVVGLCLGSFVNALVWRIRTQAELSEGRGKAAHLSAERLSIATGRSMCLHCGHELAPKDLVPVFSWFALGGRCRYCRTPIEDTPLPELLLPALLLLSYVAWPFGTVMSLEGIGLYVIWVAILTCFVALALYDARWYILPDRVVWPLTALALLFVGIRASAAADAWVAIWAVLGAATLSGIFWLMSVLSRGAWIGWGDVKLGISLGLIAGSPLMALLILFIASVTGSILTLPQTIRGKAGMHTSLPFGPHLIAATVIIFLYGAGIYHWYFGLLAG